MIEVMQYGCWEGEANRAISAKKLVTFAKTGAQTLAIQKVMGMTV